MLIVNIPDFRQTKIIYFNNQAIIKFPGFSLKLTKPLTTH